MAFDNGLAGFTPAYAGKIVHNSFSVKVPWVHPRIRGEDLSGPYKNKSCLGSPPHTRGRFENKGYQRVKLRFTPAYAGKINFFVMSRARQKVHPRIRGEDYALRCQAV